MQLAASDLQAYAFHAVIGTTFQKYGGQISFISARLIFFQNNACIDIDLQKIKGSYSFDAPKSHKFKHLLLKLR
jgi:hypothetical protein